MVDGELQQGKCKSEPKPEVCTEQYEPVCVTHTKGAVEYSNRCKAELQHPGLTQKPLPSGLRIDDGRCDVSRTSNLIKFVSAG